MKKRNTFSFLALVVCTAVLIWSYVEIHTVGDDLQYLVPAPSVETVSNQQTTAQTDEPTATQGTAQTGTQDATEPNAPVKALLDSLKTKAEGWDGIIQGYTLSGLLENASVTSDAEITKEARLNALGPDAFALAPEYLRVGRLFYPEELESGSSGILLDEQLALTLFRVAEPIGRTVTFSGVDYTVIGVLRHTKRVGDSGDYAAYIPLAALWSQSLQLDALQVTARPISNAGARSTFKADMGGWCSGGTLIDLHKEGMGALLPLRVLLFFIGCVLFFHLLKYWKGRLRWFIGDYRDRLKTQYATALLPRLLAGTLLLTLGCGILLLGAALLVYYIVAPVYTFPEWVPAVLIEWSDIQAAFWQVWQDAAVLRELRSPELIRIRYFAMLTGWCSAAAAVVLTSIWFKLRHSIRGRLDG